MRDFESMNQEGGAQPDRTTSGRREVPSESKIHQGRQADRDPRVVTHMPDLGMRTQANGPDAQDDYHPFRASMKRRPLPSLRGKYLFGCLLVGSFVIVWGLSQVFDESDAEKDAASRAEGNRETASEHGELPPYSSPSEADAPEMSPMSDYPDTFPTNTPPSSSDLPWNTPTPYAGSPDMIPVYGAPAPTPYETTPQTELATGYGAANPLYTNVGQPAAPQGSIPPYASQPTHTPEPQYGQGTQYATDPIYASEANPTPWNVPRPTAPTWDSSNAWGTTPNPAPQVAEQTLPQNWGPAVQPSPAPVQYPQPQQTWNQNASLEQPLQGMTAPQGYQMTVPQHQGQTQPTIASNGMGTTYPPMQQQPVINQPPTNWTNQPTQPNYAVTSGPATDAWNQTLAQTPQPQQHLMQTQPPQQQTPVYTERPGAAPPRQEITTNIPGMPIDRGVEYTAGLQPPNYTMTVPTNPPVNPNPNGYQYQPGVPPQFQPQPETYYPPTGGSGQMQPTYR